MARVLKDQVALDLFTEPEYPARPPTWEDVQKGRAHVAYRYEACDKCAGAPVCYWDGEKCTHVKGNYAYPKKQPDDTCRKCYIAWGHSPKATVFISGHELFKCRCDGLPRLVCGGNRAITGYRIVCPKCKQRTRAHHSFLSAAREWNRTMKGE